MKSFRDIFDQAIRYQPSGLGIHSFGNFQTLNENWKDHFEEGLRQLKGNNPDTAEQSFSRALKILSASPKSTNFNEEKATCFHSMAELYRIRSLQQLKNEHFCEMVVKSIALSEAERMYKHGGYKEDVEINAAISEAEVKLIGKVFGTSGVERFKKTKDRRITNRIELKEIRSKITNEYFPMLTRLPDWNSEDAQKRCDAIESIYGRIHDDMKRFLIDIFLYCCEIAGPAPCNYSIIGLGSTSRKEGTPYSDLEFAILLYESKKDGENLGPEHRQYFRFLTYFIQAQIIKLGETILPSVGIASLNDFYSESKEDDWFYDDIIPKGFSFDGMMPWACKTPLGKKEWRGQPPQEFIMTVDEMLELQNVDPNTSIESLQTANIFRSVCHLFGDENLTKTYEQKLTALLTHVDRVKTFQQQVLTIMQNLSETYTVSVVNSLDCGKQQDVKKEVYRFTSLLVEQLSKFFGIFGRSSWQCIREMSEKKILTEDGAKNLLAALSITTELRLQCYQKHGRQKEALPTVPNLSVTEKKITLCPLTTAIIRLYQSLLPLESVVSEVIGVIESHVPIEPQPLVLSLLQQENFMDTSPLTTSAAYLRILQLPKALACLCSAKDGAVNNAKRVKILLLLASCYHMVGKFQKVCECCREVETLYSAAPDAVGRSRHLSALTMLMIAYIDLGMHQEAVEMHKQIMDLPNKVEIPFKEELDFLTSSATLFINVKQFRKAEGILRNIIEKLVNKRKYLVIYLSSINMLAIIFVQEDKLTEAKTLLDNALLLASELYGENAVHPLFARCLALLGEVHCYLHNTEEANRLLQSALIIYRHVHEQQLLEPAVFNVLIAQAEVYRFVEKWDEMYSTLTKAKETADILYGDDPHPNVALVLLYFGFFEQERGRFSTALNYYQDCLKIRAHQRKECRPSSENCGTANILLHMASLGVGYVYDASYRSFIEKALEIEEQVHGKGSDHSHLAICFGTLGHRLMLESNGAQGLEYLEKAIQMFEEMNLDDTDEYAHVNLYMGTVLKDVSPNKAEKHFRIAEEFLNKTLKDNGHVLLLHINSSLLQIFLRTNRIQDGIELAKHQRGLIDAMLSKSGALSLQQFCQLFRLSTFYEACGRRNTAKELFIDLIARMKQQVNPTDPEQEHWMYLLWTAEKAVGLMFQSNGMFCEAEAMFQRCSASTQIAPLQWTSAKEFRLIMQDHLALIFIETKRYSQAYDLLGGLINMYEVTRNLSIPL